MAQGWLERRGEGRWWRGAHGVRAGWRVAMYLLITVALVFLCAVLIPRGFLLRLAPGGRLTPGFVTLNELLLLLPVGAASCIMTRLEGRPFHSIGLGGARKFTWLMRGIAAGLLLLAVITMLVYATGHARIIWGGLSPGGVIGFGIAWAAASLLTGLAEELALRGYLLQALTRGLGFWPALILTTLLFGILHTGNAGESVIGIISTMGGGAILALGVRGSGALWWSIGLHGAWDYSENFLSGAPDSGQICAGTLLRTTPLGAPALSGGVTGPEGSLLALAVLAVTLALAWRRFVPGKI
ncbi:CPBP family intramembrane glutamic endopeptidase [Acidocella sp.]|uniref:CPBP family intramembrane glutamic endopeptidase n=1 Tax=Acidocella sp. TaxID=50710 RepID=UPI0026370121|nr:CPBP family intramembrane glutamic endopeptidase [Acidocella sp.]